MSITLVNDLKMKVPMEMMKHVVSFSHNYQWSVVPMLHVQFADNPWSFMIDIHLLMEHFSSGSFFSYL